MRELCVQLERTKESLTRQLASLSVTQEQRQQELADILTERDLLKQQVREEITTLTPDMICQLVRRFPLSLHFSILINKDK